MLVELKGIAVDFPFEPYQAQKDYMTKVIETLENGQNSVLESPTGTGKTLSLLCSVLAWRENQKERHRQQLETGKSSSKLRLPTIIYASRTHTQISQVVNELKNTSYNPKITILSSRQHMCVHPEVSNRPKSEIRSACKALTKGNNCTYKRNADIFGKDSTINFKGDSNIMDIEELRVAAEQRQVCPYFLSRNSDVQEAVELVFMPYNYLVDESVRNGLNVVWNNAIVIIDEAHNLESVCDEASSFTLSNADIALAIKEVSYCIDDAQLKSESAALEGFAVLMKVLSDFEKLIDDVPVRKTDLGIGATLNGGELVEMLERVQLTEKSVGMFKSILQMAYDIRNKVPALEKFEKCIDRVFPVWLLQEAEKPQNLNPRFQTFQKESAPISLAKRRADNFFRVYIDESQQIWKPQSQRTNNFFGGTQAHENLNEGRKLNFWCFCPGVALKSLKQLGVYSIVLTSGTLSPLSSFALQMTLPFPIRLENPHVIRNDQIWVGVCKTGPTGKVLNSSYRNRDTTQYKTELGNTIFNFVKIIPDGMLVFFPSYSVMDKCIQCWKETGIYDRIQNYKQQILEARTATEMVTRVDNYNDLIAKGKGAIFYAICRGKASEGIDFANRRARAVIITGLPFAPAKDPKVVLKRRYLDQIACSSKSFRAKDKQVEVLTGDAWYQQQASRAVNQAVGRVIRHRLDFGAIILCDERFGRDKNTLSKWLRPCWHVTKNFGETNKELINFFRKCIKDPELNRVSAKDSLYAESSQNMSIISNHRLYSGASSISASSVNENKASVFGMSGNKKRTLSNLLGSKRSVENNRVEIEYDYSEYYRRDDQDEDNDHRKRMYTEKESGKGKATNGGPKLKSMLRRFNDGLNDNRARKPKKSLDAGMRNIYANASPLAPKPIPKMSTNTNAYVTKSLPSSTTTSESVLQEILNNDAPRGSRSTSQSVSSNEKKMTTSDYVKARNRERILMQATQKPAKSTSEHIGTDVKNKNDSKNKKGRQKSKNFLERLKNSMNNDEYQQFKKILKHIKSNPSDAIKVESCIDQLGGLLSGDRAELRSEFRKFLPPNIRNMYDTKLLN